MIGKFLNPSQFNLPLYTDYSWYYTLFYNSCIDISQGKLGLVFTNWIEQNILKNWENYNVLRPFSCDIKPYTN